MTLLRRLASVVCWLVHRKKAEQQLDEELQLFIDMSASQKVRDGTHPTKRAAWQIWSSEVWNKRRNESAPSVTADCLTR